MLNEEEKDKSIANDELKDIPADDCASTEETGKEEKKTPDPDKKPIRKSQINSLRLRRITLTAVFIALAVVTKSFTLFTLSAFGASGIKISFAGIFTFFPAAMFGPLYGGVASGLVDIIGVLIANDGAYIPWLTVMAFVGGCVKGLIWKALKKGISNKVRISALAVCLVVGILGVICNVSLSNDGYLGGIIATKEKLPLRGTIENREGEISPVSKLIVSLAKYNYDTYAVTSASANADGRIIIPDVVKLNGVSGKVTKITKKSLSGVGDNAEIVIPASVKTIEDGVLGDTVPSGLIIVAPAGSAAETFAKKNDLPFLDIAISSTAYESGNFEFNTDDNSSLVFEKDGISLKNSDTYRKYLAGYMNLTVAGAELVMVIGLAFIAIEFFVTEFEIRKKGKERGGYLRIAASTVISGVLVTTVNTFILQTFLPAYAGRTFLILWLPRLGEELIVCLIQSYIISLLLGVIMNTKFGNYVEKL